jgi:hypothetical protein
LQIPRRGGSLVMMLRVTRLAVLVVATIALWACTCPPPADEIFLLRTPLDAQTQMLVDQCLDPSLKDCEPLCEQVSGQNTIVHCEIHPQTDPAFIQVHVGLQSFCPGD